MTGSEGSPWAPSSVPALGAVDCEHGPLSDDPLEKYPVYRTLRCMLSVRYTGFAEHDAVQDEKKYRNERRLCSKVERYLSIGVTVVRSDNAISTGSDCWNNRIPSTSPFSVQVEETGASGSESQEAYQAAAECRFLDGHGITRQCHSKGLYFSRKNFGEILISACEQVVKCR